MSGNSDTSRFGTSRRRVLGLLGGTAAAGLAGCVDDPEAPEDDDPVDDDPEDDEPEDDEPADVRTNADKAQAAWERASANPAPEDEDLRNEAYIEMEEAVRDDAVMVPLYHNLEERFWYDRVDVPRTGALGGHWQQYNTTTVEGQDELGLINSTFDELDPIMSTDTASSAVITQIFENLTEFTNGVPELENNLLDEFEVSEDGTTWTFTLKEGVEFHDGTELTAEDVKYSWRRTVESPNSERAGFTLNQPVGMGIAAEDGDVGAGNVAEDSLAVEVIDDLTLEVELVGPNPGALDVIAYSSFMVLPEGLVGDIPGYDGEITHDEFITEGGPGTGPFEIDFFDVDEAVRVERFDDYHGEVAELEAVNWEIIEDDEAAWTFALEGNADIFGIPTQFYEPDAIDASPDDRGREVGTYGPAGELDEEVNYLSVAELSTFYFGFNAEEVPRAVRQAVAFVLDKEQLIEDVFAGRGVPAYSFMPPGLWPGGEGGDAFQNYLDEYPYSLGESDSEGAQEVLEEAGFTPDDPFEGTITTYEDVAFQNAAELVRDLLAGSGVDWEIEEELFSTLQDRGEDGDLELYTLGWIWSWPDPAYGTFQIEPKNTETGIMPEETNGFYLNWHTELEEEA